MPVPSAVISVPISWLPSILSKRARSTLRILPRNGSTAWDSRLRPCLAEPPAESPSTMNSSDLDGSRSWQSASLPGREFMSSAPLRRGSSRALRGASRGAAAPPPLPSSGLLDHLADDRLGFRRMLFEPGGEAVVDGALDRRADLGGNELVLGLRREFRVRHLDRQHRG